MRKRNQFDRSGLFDAADGRLPIREFECRHTTRRALSQRADLVCMNFVGHRTRLAAPPIFVAGSDWSVRMKLRDSVRPVLFGSLTNAGASTSARSPVLYFTSRRARSSAVSNQRLDLLNDGSEKRDVLRCRESLRYGGRIVYSLQCSGSNHRHAMQCELNHLPMVMVMRDRAPAKGVD